MMERCERAALLVDRSKFELVQFERVCALGEIDDLVTDATPSRRLATALSGARIRTIVAAAE